MRTVFLRVLEADDKAAMLRVAINGPEMAQGRLRFEVESGSFASVPRSPFAYWASASIRALFKADEPFEASGRAARVGVATLDNFRFVRLAWEIAAQLSHNDWCPYAKGGAYSPFYDDVSLRVKWAGNGREVKRYVEQTVGSASRKVQATEFYFRPGVTWPSRTQSGFAPRVLPSGCIFDTKGNSAFIPADHADKILTFLSLFLGSPFRALVDLQMAFGSYEVGVIQRTPVPDLTPADEAALAGLARRGWSHKRRLDTRTETSHAFVLPSLLQVDGETLAARSASWSRHVQEVETELAAIQAEIDERCFELYRINDEDRRAITEGFGGSEVPGEEVEGAVDLEEEAEAEAAADAATLAAELVSWAVGVAFGRFDVRLATGARALPAEPEPFDALPLCSPAMLTGDDGLPLASPPDGSSISFPEDGILVDDPGHPRDLTAAVRTVFETVFGPKADAIWQEAAALLDPRDHDLRNWLASGFFEHHLKHHSKSRRRAPIVWQLGVPSARYSTWLYAHRLSRDTLFALGRDIVAPKLALEERRRTSLVQDAGPNPTAKQRADIAAQDAIVEELRALVDEVRRVAPLWNPDLDDGIVLVMAPLWRLVPGHRVWQKELKSRWDELVAGKYDWAHLAMHLWPERVVSKCATDRSLAIAHDLEDVFWVEGAEGKWLPRSRPTRSIDDLVSERTSAAVKAALAELLAAAAANGPGGRRGRSTGVMA
jgi:hypothetical protein